jgi:hypothetical protein
MKCKIVCVNKRDHHKDELTIDKIYDAWYDEKEFYGSSTGFYYTIINDRGIRQEYYFGYFKTVESWRDSKLEKLI